MVEHVLEHVARLRGERLERHTHQHRRTQARPTATAGIRNVVDNHVWIIDVQLHMISAMIEQEALVPAPAHGFTLTACVAKPRSRGA